MKTGLGVTATEKQYIDIIREALRTGRKMNKRQVEKIAEANGITNKNFVKELTELAIVHEARSIASSNQDTEDKYNAIVELYKNQVNLSHRTSRSMMLQQYSTPAPISFLASTYVLGDGSGWYFEPSAGNGLMTIAIPYRQCYVNEVDDIRLSNLKTQPFAKITNQDASKPFPGYNHKFDGVVTNPPFGTLDEAQVFGKWKIKTLDHAMAIHALNTMKDNGRAAIIIGGHTTWDEHGRILAGKNRIFFNYLYHHYNIDDVILIDGHKLYSRQGTAFDVRLILIDGRKSKPDGAAPLRTEVGSTVINSFEKLYQRIAFNIHTETTEEIKKQIEKDIAEHLMKVKDISLEAYNTMENARGKISIIVDHFFGTMESTDFYATYPQFKNRKTNIPAYKKFTNAWASVDKQKITKIILEQLEKTRYKAAWELTFDELKSIMPNPDKDKRVVDERSDQAWNNKLLAYHRESILQAVVAGEEIPNKVKLCYPDIFLLNKEISSSNNTRDLKLKLKLQKQKLALLKLGLNGLSKEQKINQEFNKHLLQHKNNKLPKSFNVFKLGNTPKHWIKYGIPDAQIFMKPSVIRKAVEGKHYLLFEHFINLPAKINDIEELYQSSTISNSIIAVTEMKDIKNKTIIIPIHIKADQRGIEIMRIPTVYGRNRLEEAKKRWKKISS